MNPMKSFLFFIAFIHSFILPGQPHNSITPLSYPITIFNSDTCCWRKLSASGQYEEAAQLILSYYGQNKKTVSRQPLYWHAGQCFAMAGTYKMAVKYMKKTYCPLFSWLGGEDGKTWYYYANGTVAFLEQDKKTLARMISKWRNNHSQDLNYQALLELKAHGELPYEEINKKL